MFLRGEAKLGAVMGDEEISFLQRDYSNVSIALIDNVGHLLHLQEQGQAPVLTEMTKFLDRLPKR